MMTMSNIPAIDTPDALSRQLLAAKRERMAAEGAMNAAMQAPDAEREAARERFRVAKLEVRRIQQEMWDAWGIDAT